MRTSQRLYSINEEGIADICTACSNYINRSADGPSDDYEGDVDAFTCKTAEAAHQSRDQYSL
jgi:hypothetical protein